MEAKLLLKDDAPSFYLSNRSTRYF